MSDQSTELRQAADRLQQARRAFERGEKGLQLLRRSRTAFIHSLRNTGLTYAQARTKYDNCVDEQQRIHQQDTHRLQYAERLYQSMCLELQRNSESA